jgi:hypothetical protein
MNIIVAGRHFGVNLLVIFIKKNEDTIMARIKAFAPSNANFLQ